MSQELREQRERKLKIIEANIKAIDDKLVRLYANRKSLHRKAKLLRRQIGE